MTVVGETGCPEDAVRISSRVKPDILVIDFGGQGARALRAIQRLRAREPEPNVLVLTDREQQESLDAIIEAGAQGCIGKNRTAEELVIAVDLVSAGRMRLPHRASQLVRRRSAWSAHFRAYCKGSLNARFQPLVLACLIVATACDRPADTAPGLPGGVPFLERDSAGVLVATTLGTRARAPNGWVVDTVPEYQMGEVEGEAKGPGNFSLVPLGASWYRHPVTTRCAPLTGGQ